MSIKPGKPTMLGWLKRLAVEYKHYGYDGGVHLCRYVLVQIRGWKLAIHVINQAGSNLDLWHDHPQDQYSIVLWGRSTEHSANPIGESIDVYRLFPGKFRGRPALHRHAFEPSQSTLVTLILTPPRYREAFAYDEPFALDPVVNTRETTIAHEKRNLSEKSTV